MKLAHFLFLNFRDVFKGSLFSHINRSEGSYLDFQNLKRACKNRTLKGGAPWFRSVLAQVS